MAIEGNYSIQKGDTLWALAKKQLQAGGNEKPSNAQIVVAMKTIAQANGCQTPDECREKFFNQIGAQIQVEGLVVEKTDSKPAPAKPSAVLTAKDKAEIDEIRGMTINSPELGIRARMIDIDTYAKYFTSDPKLQVINTIVADDGGKILIYGDENGKFVGSVNKEPNGDVRNVSLDLVDGGNLSLNPSPDGEMTIFCSSATYDVQTPTNKTTFEQVLNSILGKYDSYDVEKKAHGDNFVSHYRVDGQIVAQVITDPDGKIISIDQFDIRIDKDVRQRNFYYDMNRNGKIDAGENKTRFDKDI